MKMKAVTVKYPNDHIVKLNGTYECLIDGNGLLYIPDATMSEPRDIDFGDSSNKNSSPKELTKEPKEKIKDELPDYVEEVKVSDENSQTNKEFEPMSDDELKEHIRKEENRKRVGQGLIDSYRQENDIPYPDDVGDEEPVESANKSETLTLGGVTRSLDDLVPVEDLEPGEVYTIAIEDETIGDLGFSAGLFVGLVTENDEHEEKFYLPADEVNAGDLKFFEMLEFSDDGKHVFDDKQVDTLPPSIRFFTFKN